MKNFLILLSILITCNACQETPEAKFERDGVTLTSPKGWEITDEENLDGEGYYLSIEKDGLNSSGFISVSWINGELDMEQWISIYRDELQNNIIYKNSNFVFGTRSESTYNGINTTSLNYTVSVIGVDHRGVMHFFYEKEKTFALLTQEAIEDIAKNKKGFQLIEESFSIE